MKSVENVNRTAGSGSDHFQVALPHVAANKRKCGSSCLAEKVKEAVQRIGLSIRADPQQSLAMRIDLINDCLVFVTAIPLDFVHADGLDVFQFAMSQPPRNCVFHRLKDAFPAYRESSRDLLPRHSPRPFRQEAFVLACRAAFSNSTAYNIYQLDIHSVANPATANSVQLSEFELIGIIGLAETNQPPFVTNPIGLVTADEDDPDSMLHD
jgi:hypothetical protein